MSVTAISHMGGDEMVARAAWVSTQRDRREAVVAFAFSRRDRGRPRDWPAVLEDLYPMNAVDSILGHRGEPPQCKKFGEVEIHWAPSFEPGALCVCGEKIVQEDGTHRDAPSNLPQPADATPAMSEQPQRVDMLEQAHRPQVARSPAEVSELQARLDRAEAARRAAETENAVLREAFVKHRTVTHETRPKVCLTCQESDAILARPAPELGQAVLEATRGAVQAYEDYPDRADPADVFDAIRTLGRALLGGWPATAEGQG